ncbi:ras-related protein Rab-3C [Willisornis vidua]|uniref:small monomeric GTPase n=1 Tax=Willisornis vidua TaxID=1566151 RepID=A0ABQ9DU57_9PASS|nr:ras-related protein Rab-3C [Willisornis vidua]
MGGNEREKEEEVVEQCGERERDALHLISCSIAHMETEEILISYQTVNSKSKVRHRHKSKTKATCLESTQIKTYSWDNAQVILVGNKCDMEDERVIFTERGKNLAEQLGFEFFETSAKENINVKQTFERLVDIICDKMSESLETNPTIAASNQSTQLKDTPPPQQPNCSC